MEPTKCKLCNHVLGGTERYGSEKTKDDVDLENCTIRELEMFKIGFYHGKEIGKKEEKENK